MKFGRTIKTAELRGKKVDQSEIGSAGMTYGVLGRLLNQEYLQDLTGQNGYLTYDRMRKSDPKIYGLRRALDLPILRASWEVEPAVDGEDGEPTDRAKEIAEFVEESFFEYMDMSWNETLEQILLYQDYGFAVFEKVWYIVEKSVRMKHLGYIAPNTIQEIYVRNRKVTKIDQFTMEKGAVPIPGRKLVWFVNQKEGDNFRGVPLLRPMYKPWYNKERAEILLLILAERMGGWLKFLSPPGATKTDISKANQIGREFRLNEAMYMVLPPGWEATVEATTGLTLADLLEFIKHENEELSRVAIAQVLDLGTSETGSRALGRTLGDMFMDFEQARATYLESIFNARDGIIAELCSLNFPDWQENLPRLNCGKVDRIDVKNFALAVQALTSAGMPFGGETWKWLREQAELPEEEDLDNKAQDDALDPEQPSPWQPAKRDPKAELEKARAIAEARNTGFNKPPKQPPGEGDYNPSKDEVKEQPED